VVVSYHLSLSAVPPEADYHSSSCLESFGRGSLIALLVLVLPAILVLRFRDDIEAYWTGLADMPVFQQLTRDFKTGADLAGSAFAAELQAFYADTLQHPERRASVRHRARYWDRLEVEQSLRAKLGQRLQSNMLRYLDYVEEHRHLAEAEMLAYKVPASVTLAQGILETNAGQSALATRGNNHFGIKCRARPGFRRDGVIDDRDFSAHSIATGCMQMRDDYEWDRFETYGSAHDSYRRHSLLLHEDRYRWMVRAYKIGGTYRVPKGIFGQYEVPYYAAWAVGLKQSGYATAKQYAEKITLIIETYQLWKIDYELI
jgi:flagellum-specific peptidoglycan hydrolase FlgJ